MCVARHVRHERRLARQLRARRVHGARERVHAHVAHGLALARGRGCEGCKCVCAAGCALCGLTDLAGTRLEGALERPAARDAPRARKEHVVRERHHERAPRGHRAVGAREEGRGEEQERLVGAGGGGGVARLQCVHDGLQHGRVRQHRARQRKARAPVADARALVKAQRPHTPAPRKNPTHNIRCFLI